MASPRNGFRFSTIAHLRLAVTGHVRQAVGGVPQTRTAPVGRADGEHHGRSTAARARDGRPADDDVLLREGLASLCERLGYEVAGQAGDANALLELVAEHVPDLVIVDIRMPPTHSTEGCDRDTRQRGNEMILKS